MPKIKSRDGKIHDVKYMDFDTPEEPWVEYTIEDGSKMKVRTTLKSVAKSKIPNPDGTPLYLIQTESQMRVISPEKLIKETKEEIVIEAEKPTGYR